MSARELLRQLTAGPYRQSLRRQLISGTAGAREGWLWDLAYSEEVATDESDAWVSPLLRALSDESFVRLMERLESQPRSYPAGTHEPPGIQDEASRPASTGGVGAAKPHEPTPPAERQMARALIKDPIYRCGLRRRLLSGRDAGMGQVVWRCLAAQAGRDESAARDRQIREIEQLDEPQRVERLAALLTARVADRA